MSPDFSDPRDSDLKRSYEYEQERIATANPSRGCYSPCPNLVRLFAGLRQKYEDKLTQRRVARPQRR